MGLFAACCGSTSLRQNLAFLDAVRRGDLTQVRHYCLNKNKGADDVVQDALTERGENALHLALQEGHDDIALFLLKNHQELVNQPTTVQEGWWPFLLSWSWCYSFEVKGQRSFALFFCAVSAP